MDENYNRKCGECKNYDESAKWNCKVEGKFADNAESKVCRCKDFEEKPVQEQE